MMGWITLIASIIKLITLIFESIKETRDERKKQNTELVQDVARAIIDRDASRYTAHLDRIRRLRETGSFTSNRK